MINKLSYLMFYIAQSFLLFDHKEKEANRLINLNLINSTNMIECSFSLSIIQKMRMIYSRNILIVCFIHFI